MIEKNKSNLICFPSPPQNNIISDIMGSGDSKSKSNEVFTDGIFGSKNVKIFQGDDDDLEKNFNSSCFEGIGICSFPIDTELNIDFTKKKSQVPEISSTQSWTEIKLHSPEEEIFSTVKCVRSGKNKNELEEEFDIPYSPLTTEPEGDNPNTLKKAGENLNEDSFNGSLMAKNENLNDIEDYGSKSLKGTPKKLNIRRQSLDVLWNSAAGEKFKEILSQSIMKLNISSLTEKKLNEGKFIDETEFTQVSKLKKKKINF